MGLRLSELMLVADMQRALTDLADYELESEHERASAYQSAHIKGVDPYYDKMAMWSEKLRRLHVSVPVHQIAAQ